jgi:hypothetical protein
MNTFRDAGWVWEGHGFDPGLEPSIYGVGEGAEYFGLDNVNFMFHRNNHLNLSKVSDYGQVVAEISKWKWVEIEPDWEKHGWGYANHRDSRPETIREEAEKLSRVSLDFPNITGAIVDDASGMFGFDNYSSEWPERIGGALRSANPDLKLWMVVYTHELDLEHWQLFLPYVDIINLWVWEYQNLPTLEDEVARCAEIFPGKEIIVGSYIRDYPAVMGVPLDFMRGQYETMLRLWEQERISGYSILGTCLIDMHPPQAEFIRDFIADHS